MSIYWIIYMSKGSLLGTFLLFGTPCCVGIDFDDFLFYLFCLLKVKLPPIEKSKPHPNLPYPSLLCTHPTDPTSPTVIPIHTLIFNNTSNATISLHYPTPIKIGPYSQIQQYLALPSSSSTPNTTHPYPYPILSYSYPYPIEIWPKRPRAKTTRIPHLQGIG